eukprot:gene24208-25932_t
MSEKGFRSSLAQIAVPGVAISAFVTAYATLTRDIVSKKRQLLMINRQSHHLHHSPYSGTVNRRRYCLEGQSPAHRQDSCSNLTRGLGGLGELGEGLPLQQQQQQQSPPYCPLKDTSADNIARMSLAALTLKEEVQQLESWS